MAELIDLGRDDRYRIEPGQADPRGWSVVSCDDVTVGTIVSLLIDTEQLRVRYLICSLARGSRAVALPIAYARLDEQGQRVIFDTAAADVIEALPPFAGSLDDAQREAIDTRIVGEKIEPPPPAASVDRRVTERREPNA